MNCAMKGLALLLEMPGNEVFRFDLPTRRLITVQLVNFLYRGYFDTSRYDYPRSGQSIRFF